MSDADEFMSDAESEQAEYEQQAKQLADMLAREWSETFHHLLDAAGRNDENLNEPLFTRDEAFELLKARVMGSSIRVVVGGGE